MGVVQRDPIHLVECIGDLGAIAGQVVGKCRDIGDIGPRSIDRGEKPLGVVRVRYRSGATGRCIRLGTRQKAAQGIVAEGGRLSGLGNELGKPESRMPPGRDGALLRRSNGLGATGLEPSCVIDKRGLISVVIRARCGITVRIVCVARE